MASNFFAQSAAQRPKQNFNLRRALPLARTEVPNALRDRIKIGQFFEERWFILCYIGRGGYGYVFKAYDSFLRKDVAIKFDPDFNTGPSLFKEYCMQNHLNKFSEWPKARHTIPKVYLFSYSGDLAFIVMEFLGMSLADVWEHHRPLYPSEIIQVGIRLLYALENIHSLDIVHCDLKPDNILMPADKADFSAVRLIDFGVSKTYRDHNGNLVDEEQIVQPGGPLDYLSRSAQDCQPVLPGDDVESLAYVLLELFTGSLPWTEKYEEYENKETELQVAMKTCELLKNLSAKSVCFRMPQFAPFLDHIHNMDRENPDYEMLRHILRTIEFPDTSI